MNFNLIIRVEWWFLMCPVKLVYILLSNFNTKDRKVVQSVKSEKICNNGIPLKNAHTQINTSKIREI